MTNDSSPHQPDNTNSDSHPTEQFPPAHPANPHLDGHTVNDVQPGQMYPSIPSNDQAYSNLPPTTEWASSDTAAGIPPGYSSPDLYTEAPSPAQPPKRTRRTGRIVAAVAVVMVLLLVIAGVGSELYLRSATKDCLAKSFSTLTGSSASVSLSKKPMLLQYFSSSVPYVQVDSGNNNGSAIELHGRADNISAGSDGSTVGSLRATGSVPFSRIADLSQQGAAKQPDDQQNGGQQSSQKGLFGDVELKNVTGDQSKGTINIDATAHLAFIPVPISTEIKPVLTNGKLSFKVENAKAFVFGVPANLAQTIVDGVSKSLFPPLFNDLTFSKLTVSSSGVSFAVNGSNIALNQQSLGGTDSGDQGTCTVL